MSRDQDTPIVIVRANGPVSAADTPRFALDGDEPAAYVPSDPAPLIAAAKEAKEKPKEIVLPHLVYQARVAVIAALRAENYSRKEIAAALGMTEQGVGWCLRRARERGLVQKGMIEAIQEMDEEAIPLALENIVSALREGNVDVAMRVAAGRGLLRSYSNNKNDGSPVSGAMAFQFNFVLPDGTPAPDQAALTGKIFGTSKT